MLKMTGGAAVMTGAMGAVMAGPVVVEAAGTAAHQQGVGEAKEGGGKVEEGAAGAAGAAGATGVAALGPGLALGESRGYLASLVPCMCLNRYYVAEGVRIYSQRTWAQVMGHQGRHVVTSVMDELVAYYFMQSEADNHAVREAACQCIAELATKVDPAVVRPYVARLLDALMVCFRDDR
jgi:hypothetical protein